MLELQVMPPLNEQGNGSDGDRTWTIAHVEFQLLVCYAKVQASVTSLSAQLRLVFCVG
jgi:hypothetical protein